MRISFIIVLIFLSLLASQVYALLNSTQLNQTFNESSICIIEPSVSIKVDKAVRIDVELPSNLSFSLTIYSEKNPIFQAFEENKSYTSLELNLIAGNYTLRIEGACVNLSKNFSVQFPSSEKASLVFPKKVFYENEPVNFSIFGTPFLNLSLYFKSNKTKLSYSIMLDKEGKFNFESFLPVGFYKVLIFSKNKTLDKGEIEVRKCIVIKKLGKTRIFEFNKPVIWKYAYRIENCGKSIVLTPSNFSSEGNFLYFEFNNTKSANLTIKQNESFTFYLYYQTNPVYLDCKKEEDFIGCILNNIANFSYGNISFCLEVGFPKFLVKGARVVSKSGNKVCILVSEVKPGVTKIILKKVEEKIYAELEPLETLVNKKTLFKLSGFSEIPLNLSLIIPDGWDKRSLRFFAYKNFSFNFTLTPTISGNFEFVLISNSTFNQTFLVRVKETKKILTTPLILIRNVKNYEFDCQKSEIEGNFEGFAILIENSFNVTLSNCKIRKFLVGLLIRNSSFIRLSNLTMEDNEIGIILINSEGYLRNLDLSKSKFIGLLLKNSRIKSRIVTSVNKINGKILAKISKLLSQL